MSASLIVAIVIVAVLLIGIAMYNSLVRGRNSVRNAISQIETQLQRRLDLIPNLTETVKGYAGHESKTLQAVTEARTGAAKALQSEDVNSMSRASDRLALSINAVGEAYPDLKASSNFTALQDALADTEDKIAAARRLYNNEVNDYNTSVQSFPKSIFAAVFGFKTFDPFQADRDADKPVKVSFSS